MWIDIYDPATSLKRGDGPILTATSWEHSPKESQIGKFSFSMPAGDPRSLNLHNKDEVYCNDFVNGAVVGLGAGIVEKIERVPGSPSMIKVSGPDLLQELTYRSVHYLEIYETETVDATAVSHVWRYGDGEIYYSDLLAEAYDGNAGTYYQIDTGIKSYNYLYVGASTPISACTITFQNASTAASGTLSGQYFDGTEWQTLTIGSDGTHDGTRTLGQSGKITFTRPSDQEKTTHDGVEAYWARLWPDVDTTDAVYLAEVDVDQDCESTTALADIMAYAPGGWSVYTGGDGYAATEKTVYLQFAGENVFEALVLLAEHTGESFRAGPGKTIEWLQDDLHSTPADSGIRALYGADPNQITNLADCVITDIAEIEESYDKVSRVYPIGGTDASISLANVSAAWEAANLPAGYTLSTTYNYIKHDANDAATRIERTMRYPEVGTMSDNSIHGALASEELAQAALQWLIRHVDTQKAYTLSVARLYGVLPVGQTLRVVVRDYYDGEHSIDIDAELLVLEATKRVDNRGVRTVALTVATTDQWPENDQTMLVREIRNARRRGAGGGWGGFGGGPEGEPPPQEVLEPPELGDMALNNILLLRQGDIYPVVYSLDGAGFAAAIAAAGSRDAIWTGAGTIGGDHTIPAQVSVTSMPFSRTAFTGKLTLSDGVVLNGMEIHRALGQAGDLVCLVPPESGMAYCGYCWIVANNFTGAGYCVQGHCENLTLRSCYVRAYSGLVDSNPFGSGEAGAWPSTTYAATKTLGVYYTEDSLDPGEAQPEWATLNTGLSNTDIISFCLDRHEEPADTRMFCIDGTAATLWRRTDGDWAAVLTSADARTAAGAADGETLMSVVVDPVTGYVYARLAPTSDYGIIAVLRSTDHGDNWTAYTWRARAFVYNDGNIDAYNGLVVLSYVPSPATAMITRYSTDHGVTNSYIRVDEASSSFSCHVRIHTGAGDTWYGNYGSDTYDLYRATTAGTYAVLQTAADHGPFATSGGVWPDPDDEDHLVIVAHQTDTEWVVSTDAMATADSAVATSVTSMHEIGDGCVDGYWVQGCTLPVSATPTPPARAPVYVSTDGVTLTNRSGTNYDTDPWTNAIPVTCGGITKRGLWVVYPLAGGAGTPNVHACIIVNEDGRTAAIPEWGDRSAWQTTLYGARHAIDWEAGDSHHRTLTIDAGADAIFDISEQTLTLADQTANTVLAGPESGDDATPTFRALVTADIPAIDASGVTYTPTAATDWDSDTDPGDVDDALDQLAERVDDVEGAALGDHDHSGDAGDGGQFDAANLTSGAADDGDVLTADGAGGASWEPIPAPVLDLDDLDDVDAVAPDDGDVLTWDDGDGEWVAAPPPAGGSVDAADVTYTPTTAADWDSDADPGDLDDALDQLAERVDDVEGSMPGARLGVIGFTIDGGGEAITTGLKGFVPVPAACTITSVQIVADQSGSCVVDIWADEFANFPPTDADTITSATPPTLAAAQTAEDSTLTSWTTSLAAGDWLAFNVDSAATVERVIVALYVEYD